MDCLTSTKCLPGQGRRSGSTVRSSCQVPASIVTISLLSMLFDFVGPRLASNHSTRLLSAQILSSPFDSLTCAAGGKMCCGYYFTTSNIPPDASESVLDYIEVIYSWKWGLLVTARSRQHLSIFPQTIPQHSKRDSLDPLSVIVNIFLGMGATMMTGIPFLGGRLHF